MNEWKLEFLPEAIQDLKELDGSVAGQVVKAIRKVCQSPVDPDGYGKPLGHTGGTDLSGLYKIKLKKTGLRVVYALRMKDGVMCVVIISARADSEVYRDAEKRRKTHSL